MPTNGPAGGYFSFLSREYGLRTRAEWASFLGVTLGRVSQLLSASHIGDRTWNTLLFPIYHRERVIGKESGRADNASRLIDVAKAIPGIVTQTKLSARLGITQGAVAQWRTGFSAIPLKQIRKIMALFASQNALKINALIEMQPIEPTRPHRRWYFFDNTSRGDSIRRKLTGKKGLYFYFDSRGIVSYVGRAEKTPLDIEAETRLSQEVKRIKHWEGLATGRRNSKRTIRQGDIARFLSVYEVTPTNSISMLEAMIIRVTANVGLNNRLERI